MTLLGDIYKKKQLLRFLAVVLFFIFGYIIESNKSALEDNSSTTASIQKEIVKEEIRFREIVSSYANNISKDSHIIFNESYSRLFEEKGIVLLLYRNDSLVFWSQNNIPIATKIDSTSFTECVYQSPNGYYFIETQQKENYKLIGLLLLKNEFAYENQYLHNTFRFQEESESAVSISFDMEEHAIYNSAGDFLFSLNYSGEKEPLFGIILSITLYLFSLILLVWALWKWLAFFNFSIILILIRLIMQYFQWPTVLYETELFSPFLYAASTYMPSLGDFLVNVLFLLLISCALFLKIREKHLPTQNRSVIILFIFGIIIIVFALLLCFVYLIEGLIINSNISFELSNIFNLSVYSFVGFFIICSLVFCFFILSAALFKVSNNSYKHIIASENKSSVPSIQNKEHIFPLSILLIYIIIFSVFTTFLLNHYNYHKEINKRKLHAIKLSTRQDPTAEYLFPELQQKLLSDTIIHTHLQRHSKNEAQIFDYILKKYFTGYWSKYNYVITLCDSSDNLLIKPDFYEVNCKTFFADLISDYGIATSVDDFYFLENTNGGNNYLAIFNFSHNSSDTNSASANLSKKGISLYVEMNSKYMPRVMGYPKLLINKDITANIEFEDYSHASYKAGELTDNFGRCSFSTSINSYKLKGVEFEHLEKMDYNHLFYKTGINSYVVVSQQNKGFLGIIAPFSYILVFLSLFFFVTLGIMRSSYRITISGIQFKTRMQISLISVIVISFVFIGISTTYYIVSLNESKNTDILSEKAHSILTEVEHKLSAESNIPAEMYEYVSGLLVKFSKVFFSDINLFDLQGNLMASSRPEIFEEGLVSTKMNPDAYHHLSQIKETIFIHKEKIGLLSYYSAYVPFRNNENIVIAYLNLPYFAKQDEFRKEIANFLVTFINIYVLLIAFAIFIALLVAGYILSPIQFLGQRFRKLSLDGRNEKIIWKHQDEIGSLIKEYNRMIDELENSAQLLAKSERESAWREMAKQVAHEIKNPLTPMKLRVQYLKKAWDEKSPDWDEKLEIFTKTTIEQIDTLSSIATEFSDFAKMPRSDFEKVDLLSLLNNVLELFRETENVNFEIECIKDCNYYVIADKNQLLRVFNNLINNAIQAIEKNKKGLVKLNIRTEGEKHYLSIEDNGVGIAEEQKSKIFSPNFTTKSGGMGLGLAMVKSIIEGSEGKISFKSKEGEGAIFTIILPAR